MQMVMIGDAYNADDDQMMVMMISLDDDITDRTLSQSGHTGWGSHTGSENMIFQ